MATIRSLSVAASVITACALAAELGRHAAGPRASSDRSTTALRRPTVSPGPPGLFSPSNARTADGKTIPAGQFIPAARCASCHRETHEAWAESLHRNAAREPFYKESVDVLERTRGTAAMMHCESCHSPVAVLSGSLFEENGTPGGHAGPRPYEDEGVTCSVCHSITEARLDGTGSYTIRRPALLAEEDGTPVYGDVTDEQVLADRAGHRRAVTNPVLRSPEFCATCHKSAVTQELNGYKFLRGFSAYDEWQQSGASTYTVAPFYRRDKQLTCNSCHMPEVSAADDLAAGKDGLIASHRWLGANTAAPLYYGQTRQVELTEQFLRSNVLTVDIFALRGEAAGETTAPLDPSADNAVAFGPGEEVTAEVVVFNRRAAHSFPPELRDMYEPWVEFEVFDDAGRKLFHSGFIAPDGTLDESAHTYKAILLDGDARPITRHQVWLARVKAYDNFIPPGRSDIARYRFRLPPGDGRAAFTPVTLRARVNYRRFIQEYTDYVLQRRKATHLRVPVVRMAEAEVRLVPRAGVERARAARRLGPAQQARRWNDYGIGLLELSLYGEASEAFRRAAALNPSDADLLVNAAVAEMRTERFGPERGQLRKAEELLEAALRVDGSHVRARFFRSLVWRSDGRAGEAAAELLEITRLYPRDREAQRQLGQTLYSLGRIGEARAAFEAVTAIDPNDHDAHQFLSAIYAGTGLRAEAERESSLYLLWRDDPLADSVAARFFGARPEWADERVRAHTHGEVSPRRPTLTGSAAAPDR